MNKNQKWTQGGGRAQTTDVLCNRLNVSLLHTLIWGIVTVLKYRLLTTVTGLDWIRLLWGLIRTFCVATYLIIFYLNLPKFYLLKNVQSIVHNVIRLCSLRPPPYLIFEFFSSKYFLRVLTKIGEWCENLNSSLNTLKCKQYLHQLT